MDTQTTAPGFGQRIENALVAGWNALKANGAAALTAAEQFGANELSVVETAIGKVWSQYLPQQVALIEGWVKEAVSELGQGVPLEQIVTAVLNKDAAAGEKAFLSGVASAALNAVVSAIIATI